MPASTSPADPPDYAARTARTAELVAQLHAIVGELEQLHPGRSFTPDGHLVGSLGEVACEAMFDLQLTRSSTTGHDGIAVDNRAVEIKATYGNARVAFRPTSHAHAAALIVLRLSSDRGPEVVYNGPFGPVAQHLGRVGSSGQASVSLTKLRELNGAIEPQVRVPMRSANTALRPTS